MSDTKETWEADREGAPRWRVYGMPEGHKLEELRATLKDKDPI